MVLSASLLGVNCELSSLANQMSTGSTDDPDEVIFPGWQSWSPVSRLESEALNRQTAEMITACRPETEYAR
jgi:hypothetical protein